MLRLLFLLPTALYADGSCSTGRANANSEGVCPSGYELDLANTNAPVVHTTTTSAAPVATTAEPVVTTAAPVVTTAAPVVTTAAPVVTTAAPVVNDTNSTNGTNSSRLLMEEQDDFFFKPIKRAMSVHSLCACKLTPVTVASNTSNVTVPTASVEVTTSMIISLDISTMNTGQKTATGNALAFGLHAASCKGVSSMWSTLVQCMMGQSSTEGVTFDVDMSIDSALGSAAYGCASDSDCYGDAAPSRRMAAVALTNSATFKVTAEGDAAATVAQTAKASLDTASAGDTFSAAAILTEVNRAMTRPAMNATLGDFVAALETAVGAAQVTVAVATIEGATVAPAAGTTSNAFVTGFSSVFLLVAGALLM